MASGGRPTHGDQGITPPDLLNTDQPTEGSGDTRGPRKRGSGDTRRNAPARGSGDTR